MSDSLIGPAVGAIFVIAGQLLQSELASRKEKKKDLDKALRVRAALYGQICVAQLTAKYAISNPIFFWFNALIEETGKAKAITDDRTLFLCLTVDEIKIISSMLNSISVGVSAVHLACKQARDDDFTKAKELLEATEPSFEVITKILAGLLD